MFKHWGKTRTTNTKGLVTQTQERILNSNKWITSRVYYDEETKPIYTTAKNSYLNTEDSVGILYDDFVGTITKTTHQHKYLNTGAIIVTEDAFTYDHQNRMLTHHQTIKNAAGANLHPTELLEKNSYDELGALTKVSIGYNETAALQEVDYAYTIRGWLKEINKPNENLSNDVFAMEIKYNRHNRNSSWYSGIRKQAFV